MTTFTGTEALPPGTHIDDLIIELSKELDDYWRSVTTSAGDAGKTYLVDTALHEQVPDWMKDGSIIYLPDGPSGAGTAETRVMDKLEIPNLFGKTLFSAQVQTAVTYEVHRLFTRAKKKVALEMAAPLVFPQIFQMVFDTSFVIVTDVYDYDITGLGIYNNQPHQVLYQEDDGTWLQLREGWSAAPNGMLHLSCGPTVGTEIAVVGMKPLSFVNDYVNIQSPHTQGLVAQAGAWLIEQRCNDTNVQNLDAWKNLLALWQTKASTRKTQFRMQPPSGTKVGGEYMTW